MNFNGNGGGNSNKLFEKTYYSRVRAVNPDEKLRLGYSFKSGMLIVSIDKEKDGFSYETADSIFVTPTKAKLLLSAIASFEEKAAKMKPTEGFGINAGMGEVSSALILHVGDGGERLISIGKVNPDGTWKSKTTYQFKADYNYSLQWKEIETMDCSKNYDNDLEWEQFKDVVSQFGTYMNGAIAYSAFDLGRYDIASMRNMLMPVYDKLGIERPSNGNRNNGPSERNFFNGSGGANSGSNSKTYEDMEDDLPFT